jgi:alanine racemase
MERDVERVPWRQMHNPAGRHLRRALEDSGVSLAEIARRSGTTRQHVSQVVAGKRDSARVRAEIGKALGAQAARSARVVVDLACLERNWRRLRGAHAQARLWTVLKANAYGHGMLPAARFLAGLGQDAFAVALLDEALALREGGIAGRILVLGPPEPGSLARYAGHGIEATLPSLAHLHEAARLRAPLAAHLKCDTGMGRIGLQDADAPELTALLRNAPALRLRGVYSHLADAEHLQSDFCERQRERFERWCAIVAEARPGEPHERHLANSAGLLRDPRLHFDRARVGFALWAPLRFEPHAPAPALNGELEPVLSLRAPVSHVKAMHAGDTVGYSRTYTCGEGEVIATLPLGYGDGYFRRGSNAAQVLLGGKRRPVVGVVSMDQLTVSLGRERCAVGEEAVLLGGGAGGISLHELGAWAGTIDYEVLTNLNARLPREYVYDGEPVATP